MKRGRKIALCVAEKPSVAKYVAEKLANNNFNKVTSSLTLDRVEANPSIIPFTNSNTSSTIKITSSDSHQYSSFQPCQVLGHIMQYKFPNQCKSWETTNFEDLYQVELEKTPIDLSVNVVKNLQFASKDIDCLILWLDCDREGEAIAFDVIFVVKIAGDRCLQEQIKGFLSVEGTLFSIDFRRNILSNEYVNSTQQEFSRSCEIEIISSNYKTVLSYGPCQFPTLGFVVERQQQIKNFTPEKFWYLQIKYSKQVGTKKEETKFDWNRNRVFDKLTCLILLEKVQENKKAKVVEVEKSQRIRYRPQPLNTIEAQKLISRKLKLSSAQAMEIMEKLYNKGFISYPRTETNVFNPTINLKKFVQELTKSEVMGDFANKVLSGEMFKGPRNGKQDDKAHPPIHPVKVAYKNELGLDEWRIYELVARHFLACISKDAVGSETKVECFIGGEYFHTKGLIIEELNWLEIFTYDKWSDSYLPPFQKGEEFEPSAITMQEGETQAPTPLTESDLIGKMDQNGIGTDATIHEHIKNIQERGYAKKESQYIVATNLGYNLVEAYENQGIQLYKPYLRAQMENDMKLIAQGMKSKDEVVKECIAEMKKIFNKVHQSCNQMKEFLINRVKQNPAAYNSLSQAIINNFSQGGGFGNNNNNQFQALPGGQTTLVQGNDGSSPLEETKEQFKNNNQNGNQNFADTEFMKCPECKKKTMKVKTSKQGSLFIACTGFPECKNTMSLPKCLESIQMTDDQCSQCLQRMKVPVKKFRLDFVTDFVNEAMSEVLPDDDNTSGIFCVVPGCDSHFKVLIDQTYGLPNKRTFNDAFKANQTGVPNYYYQKPNSNIQSGGQVQKRRKGENGEQQLVNNNQKNQNQGGRQPCQLCGKKRHVKTSDCPNAKKK